MLSHVVKRSIVGSGFDINLACFDVAQLVRNVSGLCLKDSLNFVFKLIHSSSRLVGTALIICQALNRACGDWHPNVASDSVLCSSHLGWVFLVNHVAKQGQRLLVCHCHWSPGQLNLQQLCLCRSEKMCLDFVNEHSYLHSF